MNRVTILLLSIFFSGCISSPEMKFSVIGISELKTKPIILQSGVIGEDCGKGAGSYGSYAIATNNAIAAVKDANILLNAKFSKTEKLGARVCVLVLGDAAKL